MNKKARWFTVAMCVAFIFTGGCTTVDYVEDYKSRVKAMDWSKIKTIAVTLKEYSYTPNTLKFKVKTPYKLQINNKGTVKHYFTAKKFFRAIATRKIQSNSDGEIKAPYFTALEIFPGRSLDLYFIPVKKGTYNLHCTIAGHETKGMHGTIVIE